MTRLWGGVVIVCDQSLNFEIRKGMMGGGRGLGLIWVEIAFSKFI